MQCKNKDGYNYRSRINKHRLSLNLGIVNVLITKIPVFHIFLSLELKENQLELLFKLGRVTYEGTVGVDGDRVGSFRELAPVDRISFITYEKISLVGVVVAHMRGDSQAVCDDWCVFFLEKGEGFAWRFSGIGLAERI